MIRKHDLETHEPESTAIEERPRRSSRSSRTASLSVLPTLFTLGNLVAGFAAIHYAAVGGTAVPAVGWTAFEFAGALIFLGMLLDAVDGSVARLVGSSSDLGAQIDSLADMVTFGIAPAFLTLQLVTSQLASEGWIIGPGADNMLGKIVWAAAAVYVCGAALRLARFNLEQDEDDDHDSFGGLPSPGAAGAVTALVILHQHLLVTKFGGDVSESVVRYSSLFIPLVMLICGLAMTSSIRYVHFTNRYISGRRPFNYIVKIVIPLVLAIWWLPEILAIAFTTYALSGPVQYLLNRSRDESVPNQTE